MLLQNVIISFPTLFVPKQVNSTGDPKYGCQLLIPPDHPQLPALRQEFEGIKNAGFPSGVPPRADLCLATYQSKYSHKDYYDPRLATWWVVSANSKMDNKPSVVDTNMQPIIDPGAVFSGCVVHANFNMFSYITGNQGVAAGLNGVMTLGVEGELGRLDNKPTVDQMFSGVSQTNRPNAAPPDVAARQGTTAAPPPPVKAKLPPPPAPVKKMTGKDGYEYDDLKQAGWTDQQMIEGGYLIAPAVTPSFAQ